MKVVKKIALKTRVFKNRAFKKHAVLAIAAAALVVCPLLIASAKTPAEKSAAESDGGAAVFSVRTEAAARRTLTAWLDVNGNVASTQESDVFADIAGTLTRLNVALGSKVQKGDVVAEVDPSKPGMRYMPSAVRAPFSGTVSKTPVSAGSTVSTATSIVTLSSPENLEITALIPEREVADLAAGLKADVRLEAFPSERFSAAVTNVAPVVDSASRTKRIALKFDSPDARVNAGMFARISIATRTDNDVLCVPSEAVVQRRGETVVFTASHSEDGTAALARKVSAGRTLEGWREITSGIAEGDAVIVQGQQLLSGGERVRVM